VSSSVQPDLSIVLPVLDGAKFLRESLGSVRDAVEVLQASDRDRVEIVVSDNHSTDATADIARELLAGKNGRLLRPETRMDNRTDHWNFAIRASAGRWVMMLHADDRLPVPSVGAVLRAIPAADRHGCTVISGRYRRFWDDGRIEAQRPRLARTRRVSGASLRDKVLATLCVLMPFSPFLRGAFDDVGGFDAQWHLVQDWILWERLLELGDLWQVRDVIGDWRQHPVSATYVQRNAQENLRVTWQRVGALAERGNGAQWSYGRDARSAVKAAIARSVLWVGTEQTVAWIRELATTEPLRFPCPEFDALPDPATTQRQHDRLLRAAAFRFQLLILGLPALE
jgi:glycosyltransferase involved in cell wall biosynthesis